MLPKVFQRGTEIGTLSDGIMIILAVSALWHVWLLTPYDLGSITKLRTEFIRQRSIIELLLLRIS